MAKYEFTYDDDTRAISASGVVVGEIWKIIQGERDRQERWHRTYNAVLGGLCSNRGDRHGFIEDADEMLSELERLAAESADARHGPLESCAPCVPETAITAGSADTVSGSNDDKNG